MPLKLFEIEAPKPRKSPNPPNPQCYALKPKREALNSNCYSDRQILELMPATPCSALLNANYMNLRGAKLLDV